MLVPCESRRCNMNDDDSVEIKMILMHRNKYFPKYTNLQCLISVNCLSQRAQEHYV